MKPLNSKILFTNGCSWTWGGALEEYWNTEEERLKLLWPYHLGNLLDTENIINLALGCGSNQRIVRTTIDWILSQSKKELKKTIAIIQWTEPYRYEYYVPKDVHSQFENLHNRWLQLKIDCIIDSFSLWDYNKCISKGYSGFSLDNVGEYNNRVIVDKSDFIYNEHRLQRYTDIQAMYDLFTHLETLHSIFTSYNVEYYFWGFHCATLDLLNTSPLLNTLKDRYNWLYDIDGYEILCNSPNVSERNKKDTHPSLLGHKQIAEILYNKIKEFKKVNEL